MVSSMASSTPLIIRFYDENVQAKDVRGRTQEEILSWSDNQLERCHNYIQMLFPLPEGSPFNWEAPVINREVMVAFRTRTELRNGLRRSFERMLKFYGFTTSTKPDTEEDKDTQEKAHANVTGQRTAMTAKTGGDTDAGATANRRDNTTIGAAEDNSTSGNKSIESTLPRRTESQPSSTSVATYYIIRGPNFKKNSRNWAVRVDHNHLRITRILRSLRVLGLEQESDAFFEALKDVFNDASIRISDTSMMYWTRAVERPLYVAPDGDECDWLKKWEADQKVQREASTMSSRSGAEASEK